MSIDPTPLERRESMVKVLTTLTKEELFTCSIDEIEKAYDFAQMMEENGVDTLIDCPSVTTTLAQGLGYRGEEKDRFEESVQQELEDHDASSCCNTID